MSVVVRWCLWGLCVVWFASAAHAEVWVQHIRIADAPDKSRIVFEMNHTVRYTLFRMHHPERVVIDMQHTRMKASALPHSKQGKWVRHIRYGAHGNTLRVVLDLTKKGLKARSFLLKRMDGKPHRLVVDLMKNQQVQVRGHQHELRIAVDAGHGGEDPGAIGPHGLQEKKVTLAIARKLVDMINAQTGMHAVLTRKHDYFVPLKKRVRLVRQAHADMMISIHADSERSRKAAGASVYTLAERGATPDKVAIALAAKENAADEVAGIHHDEEKEDVMVRNILGDMAKRESLNSSQILAEGMISALKKATKVKYDVPKRARFVVLGALEIPSVLVEVDFISNPRQERKLRTSAYQRRLARAIFQGCQNFVQRMGMLHDEKYAKKS